MKGEFKRAVKIVDRMDTDELEQLRKICHEIERAQNHLLVKAEAIMKRCETGCRGLCCKNIDLEAIIAYPDFVYILALRKSMRDIASECLKKETLFRSDCVFLKNGKGPCVFPSGIRPKICVMTFCGDSASVKKEIARVGSLFNKLSVFILLRKPKALIRFLFNGKEKNPKRL